MPLDAVTVNGRPDLTAVWQRAYLLRLLGTDQDDKIPAFAANYGAVRFWALGNPVPVWQQTYGLLIVDDTWEIILQGTEQLQHALVDLSGVILFDAGSDGGVVHALWWKVARDLWAEVKAQLAGRPTPRRITINGHSYGGAVADLMGLLAAADYPHQLVHVCTFGEPRSRSSGLGFAGAGGKVRVVAQHDIVPLLPPRWSTINFAGGPRSAPTKLSDVVRWQHHGFRLWVDSSGNVDFAGDGVEEPLDALRARVQDSVAGHFTTNYEDKLRRLDGVVTREPIYPASAPERAAEQGQPAAPGDSGPLTTGQAVTVNQGYYGTPAGPIQPANADGWETNSLAVGTPSLRFPRNIGVAPGVSSMPLKSGFTKVTLVINNGKYGRGESHCTPLAIDDANIETAALGLANQRAVLLGNGFTDPANNTKAKDTPVIEYIKLTDPINRVPGRLIKVGHLKIFGPALSSAQPADHFSTALSLRLAGEIATEPNPVPGITAQVLAAKGNLIIVGQPDALVENDEYQFTYKGSRAQTWDTSFRQYLAYLLSQQVTTGGQFKPVWGFMGLKSTELKKPVELWSIPDNLWKAKVTGHGYQSGDRLRVTGANATFNGTYAISVLDADNFFLLRGPVKGHTVPQTGIVQRVGVRGGARALAFYKYTGYDTVPGPHPQVNVTKKNPGRQFVAVSFQPKKKRER